jgi:hypothetical protein
MGSSSDWDTMQHAALILQEFGVAFETRVVSAHRMPDDMFAYAEAAHGRGLRAIIAGAGGAAHLPGMLAAKTERAQWRVASEDRGILAQVQAVLNLPPHRVLGWASLGYPNNHFDQHFPLPENPQQPVLLITGAPAAKVQRAFPQAVFVKEIRSEQMPQGALVYQAWWLGTR